MKREIIEQFESNYDNNDPDIDNELNELENELAREEEIKKKKEEEKNLSMTEEEKKEIEKYIDKRIFEYECAEKYFKSNGLLEQQKLAKQNLKKLSKEKDVCKHNRWKDLKRKNIPKEISPSFICNCSMEKRKNQYEDIIKKLIRKIIECETKKSEKNLINQNKKEKYEEGIFYSIENKWKYYKNELKKIELLKKEEWAPPPKLEYEEIINIFIEENTISIKLDLLNNETKNLFIKMELDNIVPFQKLGPINGNAYQKEINLNLNKEDFNIIYKKN